MDLLKEIPANNSPEKRKVYYIMTDIPFREGGISFLVVALERGCRYLNAMNIEV